MSKLKIAYFGTPDFSARLLEKIITDAELKNILDITLVVTQPDKRVGRKQILTPSPVKQIAQKYQINVIDQITNNQLLITNLKQTDLALLFAYGQIIPANLLASPGTGFLNIHPSPLPLFRGPSPIAYPLIFNEKNTAVTLMKMDEKMDHGPIIDKIDFIIPANFRRPDLEIALTDLGFELFKKNIIKWTSDKIDFSLIKQDETKATYTQKLSKNDGFIPLIILKNAIKNENLSNDSTPLLISNFLIKNKMPIPKYSNRTIYDLFRGLLPSPGIWTRGVVKGKELRIKIIDMNYVDGFLKILKVQLEGKNIVDFSTFNSAYKIF